MIGVAVQVVMQMTMKVAEVVAVAAVVVAMTMEVVMDVMAEVMMEVVVFDLCSLSITSLVDGTESSPGGIGVTTRSLESLSNVS